METKNWIEIIKEFIHVAMDKSLKVNAYNDGNYFFMSDNFEFYVYLTGNLFNGRKNYISVKTPKGLLNVDYVLTDREKLDLDILVLLVKEYNENTAISEIEDFVSSTKTDHEIKDINDLDD